ncbi:MAG: efflux RND transporter permease subunit [Bacteroidales bacterium]|nr:efflux RND transporter permease subunit [Bacteroidales bacterium]
MNRLPAFSVILVFAVLTIVGAGMVPLLNLQYSPSQKEGELSVSYAWNGAPAKLVESEVTSRLEGLIVSISGVKGVESTSYKEWGRINVTLKDKEQIEQIRFQIATLLRQTYNKLPDGVSYPNISVATGGSNVDPILTYTINSELPTQQIEQYAQEFIVKELSLVEGISSVELSGATPFYQRLEFDPQQMRALGVSIGELVAAVRGFVSDYNLVGSVDQTGILLTNNFSSDELASIPLRSSNGKIIRVGDVCSVEYKESLPTRYYRLNGLNTINITIYPQKGANTVKACNAVKEKMARLQEAFPDNFSALAVSDISVEIQQEINKIVRRTVLSLAILLLFVFAVSRSLKYLLVIAGSLLANILIAFIFYVLFGIEIHIYTMAGITTSFGIVIDTSIIMVAHYSYWRNRKVFLAILAALLTSIGSLMVIFLLPQEQQLVLRDFASVIMINLSVSLLIAMLLIPALVEKFDVRERQGRSTFRERRRIARLSRFYGRYITFARRWRWVLLVLLVMSFGGSLYYFKENSKGNFYRSLNRPNLYINASLPQGCTIHQLNEIVLFMENYLSQFEEIEMFRTSISSASNATIVVTFREDVENTGFPLLLKDEVISKAVDYGGANWRVYGIDEHGFNNNISSTFANYRIVVSGYNFDKVYGYCQELMASLQQNRRVNNAEILTSTNWGAQRQSEYYIDYNRNTMALYDISAADAYSALQEQLYAQKAGTYYKDGVRTDIIVQSKGKESFDVWNLQNEYVQVGGEGIKFSQLGSISKRDSGMEIYKKDQEYQMAVAFGYLGQVEQANMLIDKEIERMNTSVLPVGFKAKKQAWSYGTFDDSNNIWMLLLVIAIIFFMCAVLFESLLLPLVIIGLIPLSFIGVFLVFGLTGWSFDQGGYASLIMLSGLVVNAGIYILHQYGGMLAGDVDAAAGKAVADGSVGKKRALQVYLRAFNNKIVPISLTVVSTVLGLIPFLMDGPEEVFWFAFAIGTMSGLLFSMLALVFVMPAFARMR